MKSNSFMKNLIFFLLLIAFSIQSKASKCPDGSSPMRVISDDGSYFESKCKENKNSSEKNTTYKSSKSNLPVPIAIQPNTLEIFCDKVNMDCSDPETKKWYTAYYTLPWNKAMAIAYPEGNIYGGVSGGYFWYGDSTPNRAKTNALTQCNIYKEVYRDKCVILLENHMLVNEDYLKLINR